MQRLIITPISFAYGDVICCFNVYTVDWGLSLYAQYMLVWTSNSFTVPPIIIRLPAGRAWRVWPVGPKIALHFR